MIRRSIQNALAPLFGRHKINVRVGVAQSCDPEGVRTALSAAAVRCPGALKEPAPDIAFDDIGENALVFSVTGLWMLVAMIIAVRQALDYNSTLRAVGVCLIGWLVQAAILVAVTILVTAGV